MSQSKPRNKKYHRKRREEQALYTEIVARVDAHLNVRAESSPPLSSLFSRNLAHKLRRD